MRKLKFSIKQKILVPATIISITALFSTNVYAAGATPIDGTAHINAGETANFSSFTSANSYSDDPGLNNSSWAHAGRWYTFENHDVADFTITVVGSTDLAPGFSVWASGGAEFDGGTEAFLGELSSAGKGTPHSFNSNGAMGDAGTLWMADGQGGNMQETLGYAMSGPTHLNSVSDPTGWGEDRITGWHDVSLTDTFESGVTGSTSANSASLSFDNLAEGWYTVYVGGTDGALGGGAYDLTVVSAVPEAETWAMLLAGLGLIGWRLRKQESEPNMLPA